MHADAGALTGLRREVSAPACRSSAASTWGAHAVVKLGVSDSPKVAVVSAACTCGAHAFDRLGVSDSLQVAMVSSGTNDAIVDVKIP